MKPRHLLAEALADALADVIVLAHS